MTPEILYALHYEDARRMADERQWSRHDYIYVNTPENFRSLRKEGQTKHLIIGPDVPPEELRARGFA